MKAASKAIDNHVQDEDLGELRHAAAALVRYMMRARIAVEPRAFTQNQRQAWNVDNSSEETKSPSYLLRLALNTFEEINKKFMLRCDSGGIRVPEEEDPADETKQLVAEFVDHIGTLPDAIKQLQKERNVKWAGLARWKDIDRIRELLDALPHPPTVPVGPSVGAEPAHGHHQSVVLQGADNQPVVLGELLPLISSRQYVIVEILLAKSPKRLIPGAINKALREGGKPTNTDPGKTLRALAKSHPNWAIVLLLPGKGKRNDGYGIRVNDSATPSESC